MKSIFNIAFLLALGAVVNAAPVQEVEAAKRTAIWESDIPTVADYVQDGLVLCLDAIENVAMGVSDHSVPYVYNIAEGGDYYRLDQITFDEETQSFSRPYIYGIFSYSDSFSSPFRELNATVEYFTATNTPSSQTYSSSWGCGVYPITDGWTFIFVSRKNNILFVSKDKQQHWDIISPSYPKHSTIVIDGKTMYSYVEGLFDKQQSFVSEGYQYCNYFGVGTIPRYNNGSIDKMRCFRLYNRALTEEEIAWNYSVDIARFGGEND